MLFDCPPESQLTGPQLRYLATPGTVASLPAGWVELEKRVGQEEPFLPGSGVAVRLVGACQQAGLECAVLSRFCEEGDNSRDGMELAGAVGEWLDCSPPPGRAWRAPPSWRLLFGPPAPQEIY